MLEQFQSRKSVMLPQADRNCDNKVTYAGKKTRSYVLLIRKITNF